MYTGQLEYWVADRNALYHTAQKMNMPILIKLLDTQCNADVSENVYPDLISESSSNIAPDQEHLKNKSSVLPTLPTENR